jgi:DNA polymerase-1
MSRYIALAQAVAEAHALGATCYVAGDEITCQGKLPRALMDRLMAHRDLWASFFNTDEDDREAIKFFETLSVALVHVTSPDACPPALKQLDADAAQHHLPIAADLETCAKTPRKPRQIILNKDGALAAHQMPRKPAEGGDNDTGHDDTRDALSPLTGRIASLALYAGGALVFLFTGAALTMMLRSRWLRTRDLVAHNAKFDMFWLQLAAMELRAPPLHEDEAPGSWQCSLQGAGLLTGTGFDGNKRSLESAAKELLGITVPKELQASDFGLARWTKGQLAYACADAVVSWRLWQVIKPELIRTGRVEAYKNQMGCSVATAWMEHRGIYINKGKFEWQLGLLTRRISDARNAYNEKTGQLAPDGPTETRAWLESVLPSDRKAHWARTEKSGELSIAEDHIDRLYDTLPEARDVIEIRHADKLLRTFGRKFIGLLSPVDGRFHPQFIIAGAKTGRYSARQPNFQQIPGPKAGGDFREIVEAEAAKGTCLVCADYSQMEFRALGQIAQDDNINAIYLPGSTGDIHTEIAAELSNVAFGEVTPDQRKNAKPIGFGAVYGIGAAKLAAYAYKSYRVEMTEAEGKKKLDAFFDRFRATWRWRRANYNECDARGYILIQPSGRIIHKDWEREGQVLFTLACNAPVQGSCADVLMIAIRLVHNRLLRAGFPTTEGLIACVHDELILEVNKARAEEAKAILCQAMVDAFLAVFPDASKDGVVNAAIVKN